MTHKKIEWSDKLSTELRSIDQDHAHLIEKFNEFVAGVEDQATLDELVALFNTIINDIQTHFAFEEKVMKNINFDGYTDHKKHHDSLCSDAIEALEELKAAASPEEVLPSISFLRALIIKHMVEKDLKIKDHVMRDL